jgi:hypothetical protein
MIAGWSPVQEITENHLYDVLSADGEIIGEEIPPWVARVIATVEAYVTVRVHVHPQPRCAGTEQLPGELQASGSAGPAAVHHPWAAAGQPFERGTDGT